MANNRELSELGDFLTIDEGANNNVGIATTVRISAGGLYVDGVEVIGPGGAWRGPNSGLVGAQGAQGADGAQGAQGAQGYQGRQGTVGAQGAQGADGAQGNQGYQGRQGTVGAQGNQGSPGAQGAQGAPGPQGNQGRQGSPGAQGNQGRQGAQGDGGPTDQISKAWVNFNGDGTVAIRADFNVNTIGDNGTGDYTMNFSSSMPDANYCFTGMSGKAADTASLLIGIGLNSSVTSGSLRFRTSNYSVSYNDHQYVCVAIFR